VARHADIVPLADTIDPSFAWLFIRADGAPALAFFVHPTYYSTRAGASSKEFLSDGYFKAQWSPKAKEGRQLSRAYFHDADGVAIKTSIMWTRLAQGLFGGRVNTTAKNLLHAEAHMEHMTDQSHRWDLECIEAGSANHNTAELKAVKRYIRFNPTAKAIRARQLEEFNTFMQKHMDAHEAWPGVPDPLKCRLRNEKGDLPPVTAWELNPTD
jgi:hypothetical protein